MPFWSVWYSIIPSFIETLPPAISQCDSLFACAWVQVCTCSQSSTRDVNEMATRLYFLPASDDVHTRLLKLMSLSRRVVIAEMERNVPTLIQK